jgi:hypothetical protein
MPAKGDGKDPVSSIGSLNERSLHAALKQLYAGTDQVRESAVDGYVADVMGLDRLVEIQTGCFSKIRTKLEALLQRHRVLVVYPIAREKTLVVYDHAGGEVLYTRRSPKRGSLIDLVYQLVYLDRLPAHPNFSLEVLLTREEEIRAADGAGSWRRKGVSIVDRRLKGIVERVLFSAPADYLRLLPRGLPRPFTNRDVAGRADIPPEKARRLTYCLARMGLLAASGKRGNARLFTMAPEPGREPAGEEGA